MAGFEFERNLDVVGAWPEAGYKDHDNSFDPALDLSENGDTRFCIYNNIL
jgi:hypothetical protein